jgi:hypothetical protein
LRTAPSPAVSSGSPVSPLFRPLLERVRQFDNFYGGY